MKTKLERELKNYRDSKTKFTPYYPKMAQILSSTLFDEQLQEIMNELEEDTNNAKNFKMYLDTIIINMHSKIAKYKSSEYFEDEQIKEIENQGYLIPFYNDKENQRYILLGIYKKMTNENNI